MVIIATLESARIILLPVTLLSSTVQDYMLELEIQGKTNNNSNTESTRTLYLPTQDTYHSGTLRNVSWLSNTG